MYIEIFHYEDGFAIFFCNLIYRSFSLKKQLLMTLVEDKKGAMVIGIRTTVMGERDWTQLQQGHMGLEPRSSSEERRSY